MAFKRSGVRFSYAPQSGQTGLRPVCFRFVGILCRWGCRPNGDHQQKHFSSAGRLRGRDVARGKSWAVGDFCRVAKIPDPPDPVSGPRLAVHAAGPSTRPDEAGVTFPRCATLPDSSTGRRYLIDGSLYIVLFLSLTPSLYFCCQSGKDIGSLLDHFPGNMTEWDTYCRFSFPLYSSVLYKQTEW